MDSLQVHSTTGTVTPEEAAVLAAWRTMRVEYHNSAMTLMQGLARRFPRQWPALTLVPAKPGLRSSAAGSKTGGKDGA